MSPRIGIAASLSSPTKKAGASAAPPTPTSIAGDVEGTLPQEGSVGDTVAILLTISTTTTAGEVLKVSLESGKTVSEGALMNGTAAITVRRFEQVFSGGTEAEVITTGTGYIYFSSSSGSNSYYRLAPTENAGGITIGGGDDDFDLATDFAEDVTAFSPFSIYDISVQINGFSFNVTVNSTLYNCTQSNSTSNFAVISPA